MRTARIKLYKFEELTAEAQETAISNYLSSNYENIELFEFAENCAEYAAEKGFKNAKVRYSLSYSQGDGLSFDADIDVERFIREVWPEVKQSIVDVVLANCYASCEANNGHYAYASKEDVSFYIDVNSYREYSNLTDFVSSVKYYIQECYMQACGTLEANGYAEIEYQNSEEYAKEALQNEYYEFHKDGKLFKL